MSENAKPWNGSEPVTVALDRFGYLDVFQAFLSKGDRYSAVKLLLSVGVNSATAQRIVALAFQADKSGEN
jgi:hypothetical protein